MVLPLQKVMVDSFNKIFGVEDSITITPFSVEVVDNTITNNNTVS